jgi:hypothetical protein
MGTASAGCTSDDTCVAMFSGWTEGCTADGDCTVPTSVCIDVGGEGRCALPPVTGVGCVGGTMEAMYPNIDGGGDETVCANTAYECRGGTCVDPCEDDDACSAIPGRPVCDTGTGECECADDAHCADVPGASVCVDGQCRCAGDGDCSDVDNANTCFDGFCGCSDVSVCMGDTAFDGTTFVCEGT